MSTAQRNINVLTQPKSQFTEAFRSLRTSLLLLHGGAPPKFILFTSATPSEGKTTAASNLACDPGAGRHAGAADRCGPAPAEHAPPLRAERQDRPDHGADGRDHARRTVQTVPEIPNLDILPSGPVPPFPTEMLSSEAMSAAGALRRALYATSSSIRRRSFR